MKTTLLCRLAISAAAIAPLALSTSLAHATTSSHWFHTASLTDFTFLSQNSASTSYDGRAFAIGYTGKLDTYLLTGLNTHAYHAAGSFDAPVTFFGQQGNIFSASASGDVHIPTAPGGANSKGSAYHIAVLGSIVRSGSIPTGSSGTLATYSHTLLHVTGAVSFYGLPVSFTADANGTLSIAGSYGWTNNNKLSVGATPDATVDATVTAAVGGTWHGVGLKGGVGGNINVLHVNFPLAGSVTIPQANKVTIAATGSLNVSGMNGNVFVFAKACLWPFGCYAPQKTIFSWPGLSTTVPAFNVSQTY